MFSQDSQTPALPLETRRPGSEDLAEDLLKVTTVCATLCESLIAHLPLSRSLAAKNSRFKPMCFFVSLEEASLAPGSAFRLLRLLEPSTLCDLVTVAQLDDLAKLGQFGFEEHLWIPGLEELVFATNTAWFRP